VTSNSSIRDACVIAATIADAAAVPVVGAVAVILAEAEVGTVGETVGLKSFFDILSKSKVIGL